MTQTIIDFADSDRRAANPTRWEASKPSPPAVDGLTFEPEHDEARLTTLQQAVFDCMSDGVWRSLSEIQDAIGKGSEAGISARLRDCRKQKHGGHIVERRRRGNPKSGMFEYKLRVIGG